MQESKLSRVWFITGTSTGFGHLLAEEALKRTPWKAWQSA
jgi:hypothetical protein